MARCSKKHLHDVDTANCSEKNQFKHSHWEFFLIGAKRLFSRRNILLLICLSCIVPLVTFVVWMVCEVKWPVPKACCQVSCLRGQRQDEETDSRKKRTIRCLFILMDTSELQYVSQKRYLRTLETRFLFSEAFEVGVKVFFQFTPVNKIL